MFNLTVFNILKNIWPMIFIITVILSSLRIVYIIKNKQKFVFYKEIMILGFVIYIISLFYVVTFQDVSWSSSNFIPFKEMFRYRIFSEMFYRNVVGNMIMFMPYGLFISYFLNLDKKKLIFGLSILVSITIEITQLMIGRVFDVDDIFLNILGGLVGYYIFRFVKYINSKMPHYLKTEMFYNIIISGVLIFVLTYLYKIIEVGVI